jgi:signal-transduction protein with cAMP-binding, CBS, and nucleotidyltransferase domain
MLVSEILKTKGEKAKPIDIRPDATLDAATRLMSGDHISALIVLGKGGDIAGIITERDIVGAVARDSKEALDKKVAEVMTRDVATIASTALTHDAMRIMMDRHIRHLPVVDGGVVKGVISAGDIVRHRIKILLKVLESDHFIGPDEGH